MPERRDGLEPKRAEQLESILDEQFDVAGLGKGEYSEGLSAVKILDRIQREMDGISVGDALDLWCDWRAVDSSFRTNMALVVGELYGAGDLSSMKERIERRNEAIAREAIRYSPASKS